MSKPKLNVSKTNSMELTLHFVGSKWNSLIIYYLGKRTLRFGELRKLIPMITQKVLTQKLKELEDYGIVYRQIYAQIPPKVEYSLSDVGKELLPILDLACTWGKAFKTEHKEIMMKLEIENGTSSQLRNVPLRK